MGDERWFYRDEQDWAAITERLKLTACPHCKTVGTLIRHGSLYGFDDSTPQRKTLRARRVFCSNRYRRRGCGRTISVWLAHKIRRLSLSTRNLWAFLQRAATGTLAEAIRATGSPLSGRTWQRHWRRFDRGQSAIRTALLAVPNQIVVAVVAELRPSRFGVGEGSIPELLGIPEGIGVTGGGDDPITVCQADSGIASRYIASKYDYGKCGTDGFGIYDGAGGVGRVNVLFLGCPLSHCFNRRSRSVTADGKS